jgi:hypothetical protein
MKCKTSWKETFGLRCLLAWTGLLLLPSATALAQLQTPNVQASTHVDAVAITVTRFGPYPTSITRPQGPFVLFIVNHSGALADTFSLVLKPPASAATTTQGALSSLLDLHSTLIKQRDHQLIDPLPGNYQLRFLSHPNWVVNITIDANPGN